MIIDCMIIEDEPLAMKKLEGYVGRISFLNLIGKFKSAVDAIGHIKTDHPHLLFLDIQMAKMTGIQLLESLSEKPKIIITTAFQEYALKGYELQVCDYLLKPIQFKRFVQACEKAYNELEKTVQAEPGYIFIKTEYRLEKVDTSSILYIEGMRDYRYIITREKKIMTLQSFKELEEILPSKKFMRVHNSYLVSFDKIEAVERHRIRIGGKLIPVSASRKIAFYERLKAK